MLSKPKKKKKKFQFRLSGAAFIQIIHFLEPAPLLLSVSRFPAIPQSADHHSPGKDRDLWRPRPALPVAMAMPSSQKFRPGGYKPSLKCDSWQRDPRWTFLLRLTQSKQRNLNSHLSIACYLQTNYSQIITSGSAQTTPQQIQSACTAPLIEIYVENIEPQLITESSRPAGARLNNTITGNERFLPRGLTSK